LTPYITISKGFVKIEHDLLVLVSDTAEQGYHSKKVEIGLHILVQYLGSIIRLKTWANSGLNS
jgi:hypothetical protein